jgi:hypothetical protein
MLRPFCTSDSIDCEEVDFSASEMAQFHWRFGLAQLPTIVIALCALVAARENSFARNALVQR